MDRPFLVTDGPPGGARSTLAGVRALAREGYRVVVAVSGGRSMAARSRFCVRHIHVPRTTAPGFAKSIRELVRAHDCAGVLAGSDTALLALDAPVRDLVDKPRLAVRAVEAGFATPPTERLPDRASLHARAEDLPYPVVVKCPTARVRASKVDGVEELLRLAGEGPFAVQPYLNGAMSAVAGVIRDGRLVAVMHQRYLRTWPVDCGTSCAAVSTEGDPALEERLPRLLVGYEGIFQVQFRDGHLLDVNPRIYGSLPLAVKTGINLAALHAEMLLGRPAPTRLMRGRAGVPYRWIDGDLRHLLSLARDGRRLGPLLRALVPRHGSAHSIWQWSDPMPTFERLRSGLGRKP